MRNSTGGRMTQTTRSLVAYYEGVHSLHMTLKMEQTPNSADIHSLESYAEGCFEEKSIRKLK